MKRLIVLVMVLGLIFGSIGVAEAGKKKKKPPAPKKVERVVEFEYLCPCLGLFQFGGATGGDPNLGGGVFAVGDESFLTAEATDLTGLPVPVDIQQDTDGDGFNNPVGSFCGKTDSPMSINPGLEIRVFVGLPASCPVPALLAGGTITFTLSNLP